MKIDLNNNEIMEIRKREIRDEYPEFEQIIKDNFDLLVDKDTLLFTTNAENLWEIYINNIPSESRQEYNCNTCRHFIERYGKLATINEYGNIESVIWTKDVPEFFKKSVTELRKVVNSSIITGVFISDNRILGTPKTGIWNHLSVTLPIEKVNKSRVKNAGQLMAEKLEDYRMINRALQEYSLDTVNQALELLKTETLYRGDKCLGIAKWFKGLYEDRMNCSNSKIKENIIWVYISKAPTGFCHIKSSMIGTLLDDIEDGMNFELVSRRFAEKMNPSNYMRSQVAPTQGNIEQAERIVEKLGIANSLQRRYATLDEIPYFIWRNNQKVKDENTTKKIGIFSNILPKSKVSKTNDANLPTTIMTWEKFQRTILPTAENIEAKVENDDRLMALVTSLDETSENILQWNNTFSWYYHKGIDGEIKRRVENAGGRYEDNEIRCSLIWEGGTDLDLHCVTPKAEHIYFGDKRDRYNGYLDIDANGGRITSMTPVENIRWSNNAPTGNYKFYVHNYQERGNGTTPFKVELEVNGKIYSYNGVSSNTGYQQTIFEFDYIKGQQPNVVNCLQSNSLEDWNISDGFVKVNAITISPNLWEEKKTTHCGNHTFFLLDDCKDLAEGKGRGFFNEMLKSDLYEVRKTLEAYTSSTPIEGVENASACGLGYSNDNEWNLILKITSNNSTRLIKIDRFD
ncbi:MULTISPECIES: hypothetical protein [unclassified Clostridium]|uniref:hypothetical protein n=1 Tax=unclassified Clostridium TaxID=2614128 RepID=UPI00207A6D25|nr:MULTISPECIES: hypothetical protein [unclassified Clostridium]